MCICGLRTPGGTTCVIHVMKCVWEAEYERSQEMSLEAYSNSSGGGQPGGAALLSVLRCAHAARTTVQPFGSGTRWDGVASEYVEPARPGHAASAVLTRSQQNELMRARTLALVGLNASSSLSGACHGS